eukprot:862552-Pyramimonas_sp.AAC.1
MGPQDPLETAPLRRTPGGRRSYVDVAVPFSIHAPRADHVLNMQEFSINDPSATLPRSWSP